MNLRSIIDFFTSLRLTVVCLSLGLVLVFIGTLAQVDLGLYKAQNEFFRSFFIFWGPSGASWKIPVFPGGYTVGFVLLINLIAAHIRRFTLSRKKIGIFMIHAGIILLLLGQLMTDMLSSESLMHLRNGQTRNYSEEDRRNELAIIDLSDPQADQVVSIPEGLLTAQRTLHTPALPFSIQVLNYYRNSSVGTNQERFFEPSPANQGGGVGLWVRPEQQETSMDLKDIPTGAVELISPQGSLGKWLVSAFFQSPQTFTYAGHTYALMLRAVRHYKPFTMKLLNFNHAIYRGTDIPKDFSSMVRLERPDTGEAREVRIFMNNPLRYNGETYYQASFDPDDKGTVLQVVHNPSWLTPYFSCILVGSGMLVQFLMHLFEFAKRRMKA